MHALICGAGLIGVTTAYYLAKDGHEVTVVDRRDGPAEETSFANGGQLSPSYVDPWASPGNLKRMLGWIGQRDAPLLYRLRLDPPLWEWTVRFLANCSEKNRAVNTNHMLRIAMYSLGQLQALREELGINYGQRNAGTLHIFRSPEAFERARLHARRVTDLGCKREPIGRDECLRLEPALAHAAEGLAGAFHSPLDETGNAHTFCLALAKKCEAIGVRFYFDTSISSITRREFKIVDVRTTKGPFRADAFVIALGSYSALVAKTGNITLPVQPAKGYSVTMPIADEAKAPIMGIIDDERKHVYSRLNGDICVAGMAEIGGFETLIDDVRVGFIRDSALDLFPGAADKFRAEYWAGLSPQTPDSVPIIGRSGLDNLYINTGHGTLGWTMACGSARLLTDLMTGCPPAIDPVGFDNRRFFGVGPGPAKKSKESKLRKPHRFRN